METLPTILIIEDDRDLQDLYRDAFTEAGFNVLQAYNGAEAVDLLETAAGIKVILVDIMLPKVSGYEVIGEIRQNALTKDIPVMVVSALDALSDKEHSSMLGATSFHTKGEKPLSYLVEQAKIYAGI